MPVHRLVVLIYDTYQSLDIFDYGLVPVILRFVEVFMPERGHRQKNLPLFAEKIIKNFP